METIAVVEKNNCIGCRACENICPNKAIKMHSDEKGFFFPLIDNNLCTECSFCKTVCIDLNKNNVEKLNQTINVYGMKNKNERLRLISSSGGVFISLAEYIITQYNGIVYGCILNTEQKAVYARAEKLQECIPMMGSKYVQSDLGSIYSSIEADLVNNKTILFTGTPCQCHAVKNYFLIKKYNLDRIIFVDFLCHGAPSPMVFQDYISELEKCYEGKIISFKFRDKEKLKRRPSSRGMRAILEKSNGTKIDIYNPRLNDMYFELFKRHYISRSCCFNCRYIGFDNRPSDITIADFWGCEKYYTDFFDTKGVSLVLVNTTAGAAAVDTISEFMDIINAEKDKCLQSPLISSPKKPDDYIQFWSTYFKIGYLKTTSKFTRKFRIQKKLYEIKQILKGPKFKNG